MASLPPQDSGGGTRPTARERWKNAAAYAAAAVLALAVAALALRLWRADLRVPLYYGTDNLMAQMFVRDVLEGGSVYDSARLGAPGAMDLRDFPIPDVLHCAVLRALGWAFPDSGAVLNLYYLLGFPLTAVSAHFVLRRLGLGRLAALSAAVLFACAPYHFMRLRGHLFLSAYYLVPPVLWLAVRVYQGRNPFLRGDAGGGRPRLRKGAAAGAALLCVLTGLAGAYYAFFSCFLLLAAGAAAAVRERRWAALAASAAPVVLIGGSLAAALAPSLLHTARQGRNPEVANRSPADADTYGLNVSEMLLPVLGHRLGWLSGLQQKYLAPPRRPGGEWFYEPIGILASIGFLGLFGRFVWRRLSPPPAAARAGGEETEDALAYLNFAAVALGTVGGVGCLFAFYVSPMIRCYDRLSIFIAFLALAGLFLGAQRLAARFARGRASAAACGAAMLGLLVLGALDQTSDFYVPPYDAVRTEYASDEDFGRRMEAALSPGSMVYQMPYVPFPEWAGDPGLGPYELLRPFLHTRTLRFSYAAVAGRETAAWLEGLAKRPPPEAVEELAFAGFRGIYLDRAGFADGGAAEEAELQSLLGVGPVVSRTGRQAFFDMGPYVESLHEHYPGDSWGEREDELLHAVGLRWAGSFLGPETSAAEGAWRWCGAEGELHVVNPARRPRRVTLRMDVSGLWDQKAPSRLVVDGAGGRRELSLTAGRTPLAIDLSAPPGDNVIRFSCDGRRKKTAAGDVVFRLWDFDWKVLAP